MAAVQPQRGQMPMQPPPHGMPQTTQQPGQQQPGPPQNPAQKIPFPLIPHIHLKSAQPYPVQPQLSFEQLFQYLHDARRIVNHVKPVEWTYLDPPPRDGTVMLVWQAPNQVQYASDGYVWCDGEQQLTKRHQNYNVDIFQHRAGYRPGETVAAHARRRYRLLPAAPANIAPCDPCLWIVHYARSEPRDQIPVDRVPPNPAAAHILQQRALIEASGRIVRKQFMLTDASNWPALKIPEQMLRQRGASLADEHAAKRQRQDGKDEDSVEIIEVNPQIDDDEDKDAFDTLTPRDVSIHRYTRHSEWMEELFASPYALANIRPVSLGLGRGGALRKLTKDFYVGALDERHIRQPDRFRGGADLATPITQEDGDRFAARVDAEIARIRADMAAMTRAQEHALAHVHDKTVFGDAEASLEYAVLRTTDGDHDPWNLEASSHFRASTSRRPPRAFVDDLVREVSAKLGQDTKVQPSFRCVSRGGYQTPPPPPSPPAVEEEDIEDEERDGADEDGAGGGIDTEMGEDAYGGGESQFVDFNEAEDAPQGLSDKPHPDTQAATAAAAAATAPAAGGVEGDEGWVVLPPDASQAASATNGGAAAAAPTGAGDDEDEDEDEDAGSKKEGDNDDSISASVSGAAAAAATTTEGAEEEEEEGAADDDMLDFGGGGPDSGTNPNATPADFDGADFGASLDFGDLPGEEGVPEDEDEDDDGMEDSAFADAMVPTDDVPEPAPPPATTGAAESTTTAATAVPASAPPVGAAGGDAAATDHQPAGGAIAGAAAPAAAAGGDGGDVDVEMDMGDDDGAGAPHADAGGNDDAGDDDAVDFEDSAFGDAFHHTEFEAEGDEAGAA